MAADPLPGQRWVRPFSREPGYWKKGLPAVALAVAVAIKGDVALSNAYFRRQGLASLAERYRQLRRT